MATASGLWAKIRDLSEVREASLERWLMGVGKHVMNFYPLLIIPGCDLTLQKG